MILLLPAERLPDDGHQLLVRGEIAAREPLPERLVAVDARRNDGDCGSHFQTRDDHLVLWSYLRVFAGEILVTYCIITLSLVTVGHCDMFDINVPVIILKF